MKKQIKNKKLKLIKVLSSAFFLSAPAILLASCSSVNKELIENSISKGDGSNFATGYNIKKVATEALKSDSGQKAYQEYLTSNLALQWFKNLAKTDPQTKRDLDNEIKNIDDSFKSTIDSYKNNNGADWELKFQQEFLDLNGGTEQAYKEKQLLSWAKNRLSSELFNSDYSALLNSNNQVIRSNSESDLLKGLTGEYHFGFSADTKLIGQNKNSDPAYADFQQFIYDKWIEIENPFVVNMSLWKYGTPGSEGMSNFYNLDSSTSITSGTYEYPYFNNAVATNTGYGTLDKFTHFVNDAKASGTSTNGSNGNFLSKDTTKNKLGIREISKNYTDDSATLILAKSGSIYNDLYIEFAAASSYLFGELANPTQQGTSRTESSTTNNKLEKGISIDSKSGLDPITSNFVYKVTSTNGGGNGGGSSMSKDGTGTTANNQTPTTINGIIKYSSNLVSQIVNKNGPLKELTTNGGTVYSIDSFRGTSTDKLNDFMFIRNQAGVHAVGIEASKYIKDGYTNGSAGAEKNDTQTQKAKNYKQRAGDVVFYYSKLKNSNEDLTYGMSIDLKSELSTFYSNNTDWLIYEYAKHLMGDQNNGGTNTKEDTPKIKMFDLNDQEMKKLLGSSYVSFADKLVNYQFLITKVDRVKDYQAKMYDAKSKFSVNTGINTKKNGFASGWVYEKAKDSQATQSNSIPSQNGDKLQKNPNYFDVTYSSYVKGTYDLFDGTNGAKKTLISAVDTYMNSLNVTNQSSSFSGYKYSQYIYSDNNALNTVLLAFGSDSNSLSNVIKNDILKDYIGTNDFDFDKLEFKNNSKLITSLENGSTTTPSTATQTGNNGVKGINSALSNMYYNSSFDGLTDKWGQYIPSKEASTPKSVSETTPQTAFPITQSELDSYRNKLFKYSLSVDNAATSSNYLSLYTMLATAKYLLEDNAKEFINYLKTKVTIGENAYITWYGTQNKNLQVNGLNKSTVKELLSATDNLMMNVNNSKESAYYGLTYSGTTNTGSQVTLTSAENTNNSNSEGTGTTGETITLDRNNSNSLFGVSSNYYTVVQGMTGFMGLITQNDSSSLDSSISERLFTNPSLDNSSKVGILHSFGNSKNDLLTTIDSYTLSSEVNNLANQLKKYLPMIQFESVLNISDNSLSAKKEALKKLINDNYQENSTTAPSTKDIKPINEEMFKQRKGYVGKTPTTNGSGKTSNGQQNNNESMQVIDSPISATQTGAYVYQINTKDLESWSTLKTAVDNNTEVLYNLLIIAAKDTGQQDRALNSILATRKVEIYDTRLNTQLGPKWASNWK